MTTATIRHRAANVLYGIASRVEDNAAYWARNMASY